jgi:hypothetical protein
MLRLSSGLAEEGVEDAGASMKTRVGGLLGR